MNIHVSPSLQAGLKWAHEVKFAVSRETARQIIAWGHLEMTPDANGQQDRDGAYVVHTLYLDTPDRDVYFRSPGFRTSKFRVRSYGESESVFVERKRKRGTRVTKTRTEVSPSLVDALGCPISDQEHAHDWFNVAVGDRNLNPVCHVSYVRSAFNAMTTMGPVRLTIDDGLTASNAKGWAPQGQGSAMPVSSDCAILEVKFSESMPKLFEELILQHRLLPSGFSKYRLASDSLTRVSSGVG